MILGHVIYVRLTELGIQYNLSGKMGQFYVNNPNLCQYDYLPNPAPCYMIQLDIITSLLGAILLMFGMMFIKGRTY